LSSFLTRAESFHTAESSFKEDARSTCIVCFDDVICSSGACKSFACKHVTCDECLRSHVDVRLKEGDVASIVCPEPSCRLPVSEAMLCELFNSSESRQLSRFQDLKALKFVDAHGASAWCPKPGCGRAVSLVGAWKHPNSQATAEGEIDVTCSCKTKFCFKCKEVGGHEPVGCDKWKSWHTKLANWQKETNDASENWVSQNSRECKCGAKIQRSSGCNHMICSICGSHFCYVCGQDWNKHRTQPGGFDYYTCRLDNTAQQAAVGRGSQSVNFSRFDSCFSGWRANARDRARQEVLMGGLISIAEAFDQDACYQAVAQEGMLRCLEARTCLQRCYVLKYFWTDKDWRLHLNSWVGELEGITSALENALGIVQIEYMVERSDDLGSSSVLPQDGADLVKHLDLRRLAPRVLAACELITTIQQLSIAVELQTQRVFDAARNDSPIQTRTSASMLQALTPSTSAWAPMRNLLAPRAIRAPSGENSNCTTM